MKPQLPKPQLMVDARCLQEPGYARRGIGLHLATMLAAPQADQFEITLLFDPDLPPPEPHLAALGDAATMTAYHASRTQGIFLQPAPFSFPPGRIARILRAGHQRSIAMRHQRSIAMRHRRSIAIVLDFIPYDLPEIYLPTPQARRTYATQIAALRRYDRFLPISRATEARLHALIPRSADRTDVTGVAIRPSLTDIKNPKPFTERTGILVVSGDDPRKNPEIAVRAGLAVPIRYVGIHHPAMRAKLAALHAAAGGAPADLIFLPRLTDAELAETYAGARLVIAPSRAEGFSMPVVEAMAQATPVLAAADPAQAELVGPDELFPPDDAATLRHKATALLTDPTLWQATQTSQSRHAADFSQTAVAARFWSPVAALADQQPAAPAITHPAISHHAKPRIAFLTPLPPTPSGCADHSAGVLASLASLATVTAFSDTEYPILPPDIAFGGRADPTIMRAPHYDAIITVLGNSGFHKTETRLLLDYGAAAILHDARLSGFYRNAIGAAYALGVAAAELGSDVTAAELDAWDREQIHMPARFIAEIAAAATPLIVHAHDTVAFLATQYRSDAIFLPFAPYRLPNPASLTAEGRATARQRLGIPPETALIASFGHIHPGKEPTRLIDAFAQLAPTRPCHFALLGSGNPTLIAALRARATAAGIAPACLTLDAESVPEPRYRDYLAAADLAIQLRRAPPGSISGALADVIAAGLPCIAAATLVEALDPPAYVTSVPDDADPALIAAAADRWLDAGSAAIPPLRALFLKERSMDRYAASLLEAVLG